MIALIDMDLVAFRCAASAEKDNAEIAIYRMNELLDLILTTTGATEYKAFLTGKKISVRLFILNIKQIVLNLNHSI